LQGTVRGAINPCLHTSHIMPAMIARDTANVSKTGPTIVVNLPKPKVPRQNLPVESALPKANRAREKATQKLASSRNYPGPHRGDPASSSFVSESRPAGFHHAPFRWVVT
jgi:hypothetical protein